jgi:hypothetical protein
LLQLRNKNANAGPYASGAQERQSVAADTGIDTGTAFDFPESILAELEIDTGRKIAEGARIEFYPGKRKGKDGRTKKTGHYYWQTARTDPDTGKRRRKYGGKFEACPNEERKRQYRNRIDTSTLADGFFRSAIERAESRDTGKGK